LELWRPSSELQNSSKSFGLSRQIEYGVDSSSALMAAMREVGLINPSSGINDPDAVDGIKCGNVDMEPLSPFFDKVLLSMS
jgi:homospermidine synthase